MTPSLDTSSKKSIRHRVIIQVSGLIAIAMIFITAMVALLVYQHMSGQMQALLQNHTFATQQRLEQRIHYLAESANLLAENKFVINALVDAEERNLYLPPLVNNFMQGKDVFSLSVVDFDGRPIFKTQENIPSYKESPELRSALALEQTRAYFQEGEKEMVLVLPVKYYDTTLGALVVVFDMQAIANHSLPNDQSVYMQLNKDDHTIFTHNPDPDEVYRIFSLDPLAKTPFLEQLGVAMQLGLPEEIYVKPVKDAVIRLLGIGVLFTLGGAILSLLLANQITRPILELYRRIKLTDAKESLLSAPIGTDDEIEELAKAFNDRTSKLTEYRDHLEELVDERTKDLEDANKKLKQLDQMKSMFIASMSHELRTPLNSIIGFSGLVLSGQAGEINEKQKDFLHRVSDSGKHLLSLISDVIDISKIEAGRITSEPEQFELDKLLEEAVQSVEILAKQKNLQLEIRTVQNLELFTDKRQLFQCLLNYLSNAVKFTETGSITLGVSDEGDTIAISVTDTGIGISKEDLSELFVAFKRLETHLTVKAGGVGLGLYLTKKIITELLKGDIFVSSEPGVGSTFGLRIPKVLSEPHDD